MRALAAIVALLPWRLLEPLGAALGFVCGSLLRIRRRQVDVAMKRAGVEAAHRSYAALGAGLLELLWLSRASAAKRAAVLDAHVAVSEATKRALADALAKGPVVVFASHTGNWELAAFAAAQLLAEHGRRFAVVAKPMSIGAVDRFTRATRTAFGIELLPPRGAVRATLSALANGDVVGMPLDQVPDRRAHAMLLPFLGAPAFVDRAPATIAYRARATVLVIGAARTDDGLRVDLLDAIDVRRAGVEDTTARATSALSSFVHEHPADWLWLHRRWRAPAVLVRD